LQKNQRNVQDDSDIVGTCKPSTIMRAALNRFHLNKIVKYYNIYCEILSCSEILQTFYLNKSWWCLLCRWKIYSL